MKFPTIDPYVEPENVKESIDLVCNQALSLSTALMTIARRAYTTGNVIPSSRKARRIFTIAKKLNGLFSWSLYAPLREKEEFAPKTDKILGTVYAELRVLKARYHELQAELKQTIHSQPLHGASHISPHIIKQPTAWIIPAVGGRQEVVITGSNLQWISLTDPPAKEIRPVGAGQLDVIRLLALKANALLELTGTDELTSVIISIPNDATIDLQTIITSESCNTVIKCNLSLNNRLAGGTQVIDSSGTRSIYQAIVKYTG